MILSSQRDLFEIPDDVAYPNCAYMSPLSRAVREAGQAGVARKSQPWRLSARDFFTESEMARALFGELIGVEVSLSIKCSSTSCSRSTCSPGPRDLSSSSRSCFLGVSPRMTT
jgi:hypothetical protein